jgi:hypothetical protein
MQRSYLFDDERDTKNKVVFREQPEAETPSAIGTNYVEQWSIVGNSKLAVAIEFEESGGGALQI